MSTKTIAALAAIGLLAVGSAHAMTGGDQVINRQPATQQPNQQRQVATEANTFSIDVGGTRIAVPLAQGVCAFDETQAFDGGFLKSFRSGAGNGLSVLAATANCAELAAARNGTNGSLTSIGVFSVPVSQLNAVNTTTAPRDYARDICNREITRLNQRDRLAENPDPAAEKLMREAERANRRVDAVLFLSDRACYQGTSARATNGDGFINTVTASMLLNGKTLLVSTISFGQRGAPVKSLLLQARRDIVTLFDANRA